VSSWPLYKRCLGYTAPQPPAPDNGSKGRDAHVRVCHDWPEEQKARGSVSFGGVRLEGSDDTKSLNGQRLKMCILSISSGLLSRDRYPAACLPYNEKQLMPRQALAKMRNRFIRIHRSFSAEFPITQVKMRIGCNRRSKHTQTMDCRSGRSSLVRRGASGDKQDPV